MRATLISSLLHVGLVVTLSAQTAPATGGSPSSNAQRGIVLANQGQCARALPLLRKAVFLTLEKELKHSAGLAGLRCSMLMGNSQTSLDLLRVLNRDFPHDPEVLYASVHLHSDLSTQAAQELTATAPNSDQARQLKAEAKEVQGEWDDAAAEYRQILEKNPRLPGIHFRIARLLLSKPNPDAGMAEQAKKELQQELEIDPSNAGAHFVLGELSRQAEQWDDAIGHFQHAVKMDPLFADAYLALGSSLVSAKRYEEAILPLERAAKLEVQNPAAHFSLATAYSRAGRKADADREFAVHKTMMEKRGQADEQRQNSQ